MTRARTFSASSLLDSGAYRNQGSNVIHGFPKSCRGFTLLEVIVALAVIAFSLAAAASAVSNGAGTASSLQQRTYAHWVAMNKIAELHVTREWPPLRTTKGSTLMARHEWFWSMKVSATPERQIRRVDVYVSSDENDESPLVTLTGFVGQS